MCSVTLPLRKPPRGEYIGGKKLGEDGVSVRKSQERMACRQEEVGSRGDTKDGLLLLLRNNKMVREREYLAGGAK